MIGLSTSAAGGFSQRRPLCIPPVVSHFVPRLFPSVALLVPFLNVSCGYVPVTPGFSQVSGCFLTRAESGMLRQLAQGEREARMARPCRASFLPSRRWAVAASASAERRRPHLHLNRGRQRGHKTFPAMGRFHFGIDGVLGLRAAPAIEAWCPSCRRHQWTTETWRPARTGSSRRAWSVATRGPIRRYCGRVVPGDARDVNSSNAADFPGACA